MLVAKAKAKSQFTSRLIAVLRDLIRDDSETSQLSSRFGQLSEEDQCRLQLFCKIHLYLLSASKYPIREE